MRSRVLNSIAISLLSSKLNFKNNTCEDSYRVKFCSLAELIVNLILVAIMADMKLKRD